MDVEVRNIIRVAAEMILLAGVAVFAVVIITLGSADVGIYAEQRALSMQKDAGVEMTRGVIGYYELIEIVDSCAAYADVSVTYRVGGLDYTCLFSARDTRGVYDGVMRLIIRRPTGDPIVYRRDKGQFYRNGVLSSEFILEDDMQLPAGSMRKAASVPGNGMLGFEFTSAFFEWARERYFICAVTQTYGTSDIESVSIRAASDF
jgi:hypothetical protein